MKRAVYFLIITGLIASLSFSLKAAEPVAPNASTTAGKPGGLDPKWKEFTAPPLAPGEKPDAHRVQFGKQDCMECHKKETPASYNQWLASKHGINNVKCGICHGDALNYRASA